VLVVALVGALYLVRLGSDPPGLYDDEASVGYNAWTIARWGVDQYGNHLPLFFVDFGDYKGPVETYLVAPLTWLLPAGAALVRLPNAVAGIAFCAVVGRIAFLLTRSRGVALATVALAALQPWMFLESHTAMEGNVLMVLCVAVACWCLAEAHQARPASAWWSLAGVALGIALFTYTPARMLAPLLAAVAALALRRHGRTAVMRLLFPVAAAGVVLVVWGLSRPGTLLDRFEAVGLFSAGLSPPAAVLRFLANYVSYLSPGFLLLSGDGNYRQTTGFGGVLLAATLPFMVAGAVCLFRRRREPYARFLLAGALVAPVPAALGLAAPHALRGAGLLPFLLAFMAEGLGWSWRLAGSRRAVAAFTMLVLAGSAAPYFYDFFTAYPTRAALAFDAGEAAALRTAYERAEGDGHKLFLSASLNQPAMQLMYAVEAEPPQPAFVRRARLTVVVNRSDFDTVRPGDLVVLAPADRPPAGSRLLFLVRGGELWWAPVRSSRTDLLRVYEA
jgi:4-amino-4-deoxy-L-arabinose transferase-like glycosyltransferase